MSATSDDPSAGSDPLSQVSSRRTFVECVQSAIERARGRGRHVAALVLDVDHFRRFNLALGRYTADLLLAQIADRISRSMWRNESIARLTLQEVRSREKEMARLGGDEFYVVAPRLDEPSSAVPFAERLLALFERPFTLNGQPVTVSATIGLAVHPDDGEDAETLVRSAELALSDPACHGSARVRCRSESVATR